VTEELDERSSYELAGRTLGRDHVHDNKKWEQEADREREERLEDNMAATEPEETFVPESSEQLLTASVGDKLLAQ